MITNSPYVVSLLNYFYIQSIKLSLKIGKLTFINVITENGFREFGDEKEKISLSFVLFFFYQQ